MSLAGRELILGVTGSIAAYKAVYLLRELTRLGASVTVCLSEHAREFVGPLTFRTLSGRPVLSNLFDPQSADAVEHVALAERAHAVVVAPATANVLAKAAHGIADDFLTTLLLASRGQDGIRVGAGGAPARRGGPAGVRPDRAPAAARRRLRPGADRRGDARGGAPPSRPRDDRRQGSGGRRLPRQAGLEREDEGQARP